MPTNAKAGVFFRLRFGLGSARLSSRATEWKSVMTRTSAAAAAAAAVAVAVAVAVAAALADCVVPWRSNAVSSGRSARHSGSHWLVWNRVIDRRIQSIQFVLYFHLFFCSVWCIQITFRGCPLLLELKPRRLLRLEPSAHGVSSRQIGTLFILLV